MIEINLLPKELQKKVEIPHVSFLPIIGVVLGVIVVVHLLFSLSVNFKARVLQRLEKKWEEVAPVKKDADKVIQELTTMRSRIDAIDELIQKRMSWSRKLSDLSDAMTPGVWLNRLWIEKKVVYKEQKTKGSGRGKAEDGSAAEKITLKTLHLNGSIIGTGGDETATVGKFMWSLENNPGFFADFSVIESAYMQQSKLKEIEIMEFELICYFKE